MRDQLSVFAGADLALKFADLFQLVESVLSDLADDPWEVLLIVAMCHDIAPATLWPTVHRVKPGSQSAPGKQVAVLDFSPDVD